MFSEKLHVYIYIYIYTQQTTTTKRENTCSSGNGSLIDMSFVFDYPLEIESFTTKKKRFYNHVFKTRL